MCIEHFTVYPYRLAHITHIKVNKSKAVDLLIHKKGKANLYVAFVSIKLGKRLFLKLNNISNIYFPCDQRGPKFFFFLFYTVTLEQQRFFRTFICHFPYTRCTQGHCKFEKCPFFCSFELCNSTCNYVVLLNTYIMYNAIFFFKTF